MPDTLDQHIAVVSRLYEKLYIDGRLSLEEQIAFSVVLAFAANHVVFTIECNCGRVLTVNDTPVSCTYCETTWLARRPKP